MAKFTVRFSATYEVVLSVPDGCTVSDVLCDIDIPESKRCQYQPDTFQVLSMMDNSDGRELSRTEYE